MVSPTFVLKGTTYHLFAQKHPFYIFYHLKEIVSTFIVGNVPFQCQIYNRPKATLSCDRWGEEAPIQEQCQLPLEIASEVAARESHARLETP